MNLFFKKLTGRLVSTDRCEASFSDLKKQVIRYHQVENSAELAEYRELKKVVESKEFQAKKAKLTTTKYKDTEPHKILVRLHDLTKNKPLQLYFYVSESVLLKEYLAFRDSENYVKLTDPKLVRKSPDLKRMLKFERSKAYKTWLQFKNSPLPKQYQDLRAQVSTDEFQKEKIFWANSRRWLTTNEYLQECRLAELSANDDIKFFLMQNEKDIAYWESYKTTFVDEFDWRKMADSAWRPGFAYKADALKKQHSFTREYQANNNGKNTGTLQGCLTIVTQKEQVVAPAWDEKKGFVNQAFEYTADQVQTADAFRQKEGIFSAKIRCTGRVHHTFTLGADTQIPLVHIFNYNGRKIFVGNTSKLGFEGVGITGIPVNRYYIYSLRWTKNELIWYINNMEVFRTSRNLPTEALYLAFASFLPKAQKASEGKLDVDWVRVLCR